MARKAENNGWICLHRSIQDWQWYDNLIVKAVFIDLLLSANSSPAWFKGRRLYRGQTAVSVETLCLNNGISKPTCLKALKALEGSGEIVNLYVLEGRNGSEIDKLKHLMLTPIL